MLIQFKKYAALPELPPQDIDTEENAEWRRRLKEAVDGMRCMGPADVAAHLPALMAALEDSDSAMREAAVAASASLAQPGWSLALASARRLVRTHMMFEKYDALEVGGGGGGGEYTPQVGFGWSNGVALTLLERYGDALVDGTGDPY